ncbi:hypothetical protein LTR60_001237 [Cryomyces antarcticus]|nr:hypothetical protein LTR60_001237 [Cryomyces antarcticus]
MPQGDTFPVRITNEIVQAHVLGKLARRDTSLVHGSPDWLFNADVDPPTTAGIHWRLKQGASSEGDLNKDSDEEQEHDTAKNDAEYNKVTALAQPLEGHRVTVSSIITREEGFAIDKGANDVATDFLEQSTEEFKKLQAQLIP